MANPRCPCEYIVNDSSSNPPTVTSTPSQVNNDDDSLEEYLNRYVSSYQPGLSANHLQDLSALHALVRRSYLVDTNRKRWKRPSWAPVGKRASKRPSWAQVG